VICEGFHSGTTIERHGELWHRCYATLTQPTQFRLEQEIARLGGHYAHVIDEHVDSRRNVQPVKAGFTAALVMCFIGGHN
jgi:hypothetical protein